MMKNNCKCDNNHKYKAGVVTNGVDCAKIGSDILLAGGSAADAAIAALLCEGVTIPESMGLGGGFLMTIYIRATGEAVTLNARETAPAAAFRDMYNGSEELSEKGTLSIAIPGELKGMWELHQRYGKLDWNQLFLPTIQLCRKGIRVTKYFHKILQSYQNEILNSPSLKEIFIDPCTNKPWKFGQRFKRLKLAETLEIIADTGADAFYKGPLMNLFIKEISDLGGILTKCDMNNYKPRWNKPIITKLQNNKFKFHSVPLPGSGVILSLMLNIIDGFIDYEHFDTIANWQRIIESFKFGYGRRTELGDIDGLENLIENLNSKSYATNLRAQIFDDRTSQDPIYYGANYTQVNDHGTGHVAVLAPNGDAISVTSTINLVFGSKIRSRTTGIILNDEMNDFSAPNMLSAYNIPPSPANYIAPGKCPLSSMAPTIITDESGDVRLIIGASGGTRITTSLALITLWNVLLDRPLNESLAAPRLHHQLFPMEIMFENGFPNDTVEGLNKIGHKSRFIDLSDGFAAVTALARQCGSIYGQYDIRRQGSICLF